jgi:hypothetical protein
MKNDYSVAVCAFRQWVPRKHSAPAEEFTPIYLTAPCTS